MHIPDSDNHTPQTAIVKATVNGLKVEIDFLWNIKGVDDTKLVKQAEQIQMTVRTSEGLGHLVIPIMHPFHCMQSRIANVIELDRKTDLATRQMEASPIVLREYLSERLASGAQKHVTGVLQALYDYLTTDINGRKAHRYMRNDPADILKHFQDDQRLDERWREMSLRSMRDTLSKRRSAWRAMASKIGKKMGILSGQPADR